MPKPPPRLGVLASVLITGLGFFLYLQYAALRKFNESPAPARIEVLLEINQPSPRTRPHARTIVIDPYNDTLQPMEKRIPSDAFKMPKLKAEKLYENPMEDIILVQ
jgi:hypothetical protein